MIFAAVALGMLAYLSRSRLSHVPAPSAASSSGVTPAPDLIPVPELKGLSLRDAESAIRNSGLVVGKIERQPRPDVAQDTVFLAEYKAGHLVKSGTSVRLTVSDGVPATAAVSTASAPVPEPEKHVKKVPADHGIPVPNFAGTWTSFEETEDGVTRPFTGIHETITQDGSIVHLSGRDVPINEAGVFTYQIFHAGDAGHNHEVATADEADRVVTFTFRLDGSTLVGEVVMDFKKTYGSVPAGTKHGIVERYRR